VRHVVIGTAGHVDHGKTALVYALTEVHTDRLPEEQRRGITIELGFAPWQISDDVRVSVIDAPGHRKLVHHMIAGASGIDLVLLVVAADEGVMPQTREHIAACKLLGVERAVIAITKLDRVDRDLAELAAEEALELLETDGIAATAVLCSAKTGEGVDELRREVLSVIEQTEDSGDRAQRVRLSVDRVFTVKGAGTVVTGTLVSGSLSLGTPLRILGPERELKASTRGLHVHGEAQEAAAAPTRLAINLGGVSLQDVARGDVITDDAYGTPTRVIDVWLQALEPMRRGSETSIHIGTARSTARLQPVAKVEQLTEGGLARLRLTAPLVTLGGDRFVLRGARVDGPTGAVVGGGVVLDAQPPKRVRAAKRDGLLDALHRKDAAQALSGLAAEQSPRPLLASALPSRFAIDHEQLKEAGAALVGGGELVAVAQVGWLTKAGLEGLSARALELVGTHHKNAPLDVGLKLQTLREQLTAIAGEQASAETIERLTKKPKPKLILSTDSVRLPTFKGAEQNKAAAKALADATAMVSKAALSGVSENALVAELGVDLQQVRSVFAAMVRSQDAVRAADLWFDAKAVTELQGRVEAHLDQEEKLTIAQFKEMTGLGRKQSIPLLEHFDRLKVTRRDGSVRFKGR